jgi:hypothetical protein
MSGPSCYHFRVTPRSEPIRRAVVFVCWLGYACSEAHDSSAHEPADASLDAAASDRDAQGDALGVCEVRDFDPSQRPDDDGPASRCRYQVIPDGVDAQFVRVMVGDRTLWLNHAPNGWTLEAEAGIVRLLGTACDEARAGAPVRIQNECALVSSP